MKTAEQRARDSEKQRARRASYRAHGICSCCRDREPGFRQCAECRESKRVSRKKIENGGQHVL